jgi:exopolysaccharide production protein ExoZ
MPACSPAGRPAGLHPSAAYLIFGGNGVDFFFVLSGYIIARVHRQDIGAPERLGWYAWRRLTRIMPPYWAATILSIPLVTHYHDGYRTDIQWSADYVIRNVLLLPMHGYPIVAPGWSLTHEMAFYGLFGLAVLNKQLGIVAGCAWLLGIGCAISGFGPSALLLQSTDIEFFLGVAVAFLPFRFSPGLVLIGVAGFFGQCFAEWMGAPIALDPFLSRMILGLSSAILVAGLSVSPNIFGKIGARLGAASYAIYLAHYPAIGALHLHHPTGSAVKIFFIYAALGIVAGLAFHALIEKPLLAWLRGFQPRRDRLRPKIA